MSFERQENEFVLQHREAAQTPKLSEIVQMLGSRDKKPWKIRILNPRMTYETLYTIVILSD